MRLISSSDQFHLSLGATVASLKVAAIDLPEFEAGRRVALLPLPFPRRGPEYRAERDLSTFEDNMRYSGERQGAPNSRTSNADQGLPSGGRFLALRFPRTVLGERRVTFDIHREVVDARLLAGVHESMDAVSGVINAVAR